MFIYTPVFYVQVEYETNALYVSLIKTASLLQVGFGDFIYIIYSFIYVYRLIDRWIDR